MRFQRVGAAEDLGEAIKLHRQVLPLRPPGHPDRWYSLLGLSDTLAHKGTDLYMSASHLMEAIASVPDLHPSQAATKCSLAEVYFKQHRLRHAGIPSLDMAFRLIEESACHPTASLVDRLANATQ